MKPLCKQEVKKWQKWSWGNQFKQMFLRLPSDQILIEYTFYLYLAPPKAHMWGEIRRKFIFHDVDTPIFFHFSQI